MLQTVQFDTGGVVRLRVPEVSAIDSASVTLYRPDDTLIDTQTLTPGYSATVTSQSETGDYTVLTLEVGDEPEGEGEQDPGPPPISLRGRRIRCIMLVGPPVEPIVDAVGDDSVTVRLPRRCGTVASILDPNLEAAAPVATEEDIGDGFKAVFAYSADGALGTTTVQYAVVRRVYAPLSMAEIQAKTPELHRILASRDQDWLALKDEASELLEMQLARLGVRSACIAERDQIVPLLVDAFRLAAAVAGVVPSDYASETLTAYTDLLRRTFARHCEDVLRTAYVLLSSGSVSSSAQPRQIRVIRTRR